MRANEPLGIGFICRPPLHLCSAFTVERCSATPGGGRTLLADILCLFFRLDPVSATPFLSSSLPTPATQPDPPPVHVGHKLALVNQEWQFWPMSSELCSRVAQFCLPNRAHRNPIASHFAGTLRRGSGKPVVCIACNSNFPPYPCSFVRCIVACLDNCSFS